MPEPSLIYTKDSGTIVKIREHSDFGSSFYFVSTIASLKKFMSKNPRSRVYLEPMQVKENDGDRLDAESFLQENGHEYSSFRDKKAIDEFIENFSADGQEIALSEKCIPESESFSRIIGCSKAVKKLRYEILKVARSELPVLITGESGVGKTLVANAIHELSSRRKNRIVEKNVAEFAPSLFESEFFGHAENAFNGAEKHEGFAQQADGTTFFLDEIGELSTDMQPKLLKFLEKGVFSPVGSTKVLHSDCRFIFATNANLPQKIHDKEFRLDLYRRIRRLTIEIPPLRSRLEDIPLLAEAYLKKTGCKKTLSKESIQYMMSFNWPGNIGQLESCLDHAMTFCEEDEISPKHLRF